MSKRYYKHRASFQSLIKGEVVEIWEGTPHDPESDYICSVHRDLVPALIAALKNSIQTHQRD